MCGAGDVETGDRDTITGGHIGHCDGVGNWNSQQGERCIPGKYGILSSILNHKIVHRGQQACHTYIEQRRQMVHTNGEYEEYYKS